MFGTSKQYSVRLYLKRYQPYSKSWSTLENFIKKIYHDPSDQVGIKALVKELQSTTRISIRVKEKEAKLLQKMEDKGLLSIGCIDAIKT